MKRMFSFRRYFIVGTNDSGLKDTMNGMVTGELINCKDCRFWPDNQMMAIVPRKNGKTDFNAMLEIENRCLHMGPEDYCSKAKRRNNAE